MSCMRRWILLKIKSIQIGNVLLLMMVHQTQQSRSRTIIVIVIIDLNIIINQMLGFRRQEMLEFN